MLVKSKSLLCAEYIVSMVQNDPRMHDIKGYIESYQNGREQGLLIWLPSITTYYVSYHRNGTSPHVYRGEYAMQSISDDAYKHQYSFKYEYEAIEWIINDILESTNND